MLYRPGIGAVVVLCIPEDYITHERIDRIIFQRSWSYSQVSILPTSHILDSPCLSASHYNLLTLLNERFDVHIRHGGSWRSRYFVMRNHLHIDVTIVLSSFLDDLRILCLLHPFPHHPLCGTMDLFRSPSEIVFSTPAFPCLLSTAADL